MNFGKIKGQDATIEILKKTIVSEHLSHAYLFVGPNSVGKKATSLAFAQAINCLDSAEGDCCEQCLSCKKLENGNHPDIDLITPDGSSIKIDQVRSLRNKVFYKCYESKFKVIIFDDAHFLTTEAANSLLKVLEEPPQKTIFILVTAEPQQLPDTIISRCQQIQFQAIPNIVIKDILKEEYSDFENGQLSLVASLARGSIEKAQQLLEQGELMEKREETLNILKRIYSLPFNEILLWCEKWDKDKQAVKTILEMIQFWFRDLLVWRTTGQETLLINQDYLDDIKNSPDILVNINSVLGMITQSFKALEYNANPRLVLEVLLLKVK